MFFPNFLTFILETPSLFLQSRQRENTLETPTLSRHRSTEEKEDRHLHFLINYVQEEKNKIFQTSKGVQRTYVTVANQSTVHRTNPTEEVQYQRTATQTDTRGLNLQVTNHSERTLLLGDSHNCCISQTFLLDRKT